MTEADRFMVEDLRVRIMYDPDPESPREWCNLGTMVCWHRRYNLGDKHNYREPSDFQDDIKDEPHIILPLYLYDHGGITMSTGPFSCPWDSGQVGWIYITLEKVRKEYGWKRITKERRQQIIKYLEGEVEEYDNYLTGEVYGYVIEAPPEDPEDEDDDDAWEEIDSCWGFHGSDYVEQEATAAAQREMKHRAEERAKLQAEAAAVAAFNAAAPF